MTTTRLPLGLRGGETVFARTDLRTGRTASGIPLFTSRRDYLIAVSVAWCFAVRVWGDGCGIPGFVSLARRARPGRQGGQGRAGHAARMLPLSPHMPVPGTAAAVGRSMRSRVIRSGRPRRRTGHDCPFCVPLAMMEPAVRGTGYCPCGPQGQEIRAGGPQGPCQPRAAAAASAAPGN